MNEYPSISDHGLIGDLQTSALVATDGTIDWFCSPRFDSPSIFGSLLDHARGGHFSIRPRADAFETKQLYLPDTAILVTRFLTEQGVGEVIDYMPVTSETPSSRHRLVRELRCVRGSIVFDIEIAPRFDYGRQKHQVTIGEDAVTCTAGDTTLTFSLIRDPDTERLGQAELTDGGDLRFALSLTEGQMRGVVLETGSGAPARAVPVAEVERLFDETTRFWRDWIGRSTYTGRWREKVERSAITLKLLTYAPTGGLVAAPTAGLPEQIGGERNWDYRYTWVRDASFSVNTLLRMGFYDEAGAFGRWLHDRGAAQAGSADRAAEHHVPGRRRPAPVGRDPRRVGGVPRVVPGADRQRRRRTAAARHLRRGDGGRLERLPQRCRHRPARLGGHRKAPGLAGARTGISRRRASGRPAADARTSRTGA